MAEALRQQGGDRGTGGSPGDARRMREGGGVGIGGGCSGEPPEVVGRGGRQAGRPDLLLLAGHGLAGAAAGAGIGAGALAAHGQTHAVASPPQAADVLQALEGHALLAAQVALESEGLSGAAQFLHVSVAEVLHPDVGVHPGLGENLAGTGEPDPVHVGEGDLNPLVTRDIDTGDPSHVRKRSEGRGGGCRRRQPWRREGSTLALLVLRVGADHHDPAVATDHPALVAHLLD